MSAPKAIINIGEINYDYIKNHKTIS